jgi:segregation and condensation protein A
VDIHSISIERITRQYLDYINTFKLLNIDLASEFIVMAANLMYLKSRTLLPRVDQPPEEDAEEDDPRWELIRQLIEYKKFKDAAGFLSLREMEQEGRFAHQPDASDAPRKSPPRSPKSPSSTSSAPSRMSSSASRNPMISATSSTTASPFRTKSSCS